MENSFIYTYHGNGSVADEIAVVDGIMNGTYRRYFENGILEIDGVVENNKFHGDFVFYNPDGVVIRTCTFADGLLHGVLLEYDNNQIQSKTDYLFGKVHGVFEFFGKQGNILLHSDYLENKKNGNTTTHSDKGKKIKTEQYKDDVLHGVTIVYHEDGVTAKEKISYYLGKFHGDCIQYNSAGAAIHIVTFEHGVLVQSKKDVSEINRTPQGVWVKQG